MLGTRDIERIIGFAPDVSALIVKGSWATQVRDIGEKLLEGDRLRLLSASEYDQYDFEALRLFCHFAGRYGLPTEELIKFLREKIRGKKAIEIGSGSGDLGSRLGIPMTDNHCQEWPEVRAHYNLTQQPTIQYGKGVEELDALEAVDKYKPDVVIGCWVTQWIDPSLPPPPGGGSVYGIKEEELLKKVKTYILIGAEQIHGNKKIMKIPHTKIPASFVRSRRKDNCIWIWEKQ